MIKDNCFVWESIPVYRGNAGTANKSQTCFHNEAQVNLQKT